MTLKQIMNNHPFGLFQILFYEHKYACKYILVIYVGTWSMTLGLQWSMLSICAQHIVHDLKLYLDEVHSNWQQHYTLS